MALRRRAQGRKNRAATPDKPRNKYRGPLLGTAFVHTVVDDHSRVAYAEIRNDETAATEVDPRRPEARAALPGRGHRLRGAGHHVGARAGADVVAVDLAPTMIERLAARARTEELPRGEARVMDGHALDLADDTFDVSASLNGVSLFPDLPRALAEMARVTRPGGTVLIAAFCVPRQVEFIGWFVRAVQAVVPDFVPLPTDPPPLPFQVADPARPRQVLSEAGPTSVAVETVTWETHVESGRQLIDAVRSSNPIGAKWLAELSGPQTDEVERVLDGMLRERSGGGPGAVLRNATNIGVGTK